MTWRLAGSIPPSRGEVSDDRASNDGPFRLRETRIAAMVQDAIQYGAAVRQMYSLYAWVVMPNHVHVILQPRIELSSIMRYLKGRTSRAANRMLGRTGARFWQDESFDHWVRCDEELRELIGYVENNPVKAGLVKTAAEWRWSSARFGLKADDKQRWSAPLPLFLLEHSD